VSRYEVTARTARHKVIVGWDPPMQTYFGQVIDRRKEETDPDNKIVLWVGTSLRQLSEVEQLARRLAPFAGLSEDERARLASDKEQR
jgi:hypothetical protein